MFWVFFCCGGTEKTFLSLLTTHGPCRSLLPPCIPIRLRVNRLGVWPQHHLEHADVPAEHTTGHLLHPHPGLPHLRLRPGGQLQLHQHRPQHRHSQRHHWSVVLLHLSRSHSLRLAQVFFVVFNSLWLILFAGPEREMQQLLCFPLKSVVCFQILPVYFPGY